MTSHNKFKLRSRKKPWDVVRASLFEFSVTCHLPWAVIESKTDHGQTKIFGLAGKQQENDGIKLF